MDTAFEQIEIAPGWVKQVWTVQDGLVALRYIENRYGPPLDELAALYPDGLPLDLSIHHGVGRISECDIFPTIGCTLVWLGGSATRHAGELSGDDELLFEWMEQMLVAWKASNDPEEGT